MYRWSDRWVQVGVDEAGDPLYVRNIGGADDVVDYDSMTKAQLQALAEERGVAKSGTKDELIERLGA